MKVSGGVVIGSLLVALIVIMAVGSYFVNRNRVEEKVAIGHRK